MITAAAARELSPSTPEKLERLIENRIKAYAVRAGVNQVLLYEEELPGMNTWGMTVRRGEMVRSFPATVVAGVVDRVRSQGFLVEYIPPNLHGSGARAALRIAW